MSSSFRPWRPVLILMVVSAVLLALTLDSAQLGQVKAKGLRRSSAVLASVANASRPGGPALRPPVTATNTGATAIGLITTNSMPKAVNPNCSRS